MGVDSLHAPLAPSRASRWGPGACPGSAAMERRYPEDTESEAAREGTAAHYYATEALQGRNHPVGTLAPNGFPINLEIQQCAATFLADVRDTLAAATPGSTLRIEERVDMSTMVHRDNWGTPDVYLLDSVKRALHVWDYKYGHRYVDAFKNWQMIDYAIGILECEGVEDWFPWRVTLTVAQPRNYSPEGTLREWYLSGAQLRDHAGALREAAILASHPDAELRTGPHCRDCNAGHACPALQRAAMNAVDLSYRQTNIDMPAAAVGLELRILTAAAQRLKARADALEEHAIGLVRKGENVPHWTMGRMQPRKKWIVPDAEIIAMGRIFGKDLATAITPPQAIKAGIDPAVIQQYSETPPGSLKLVPVDDSAAEKAFGPL